MTHDQTDTAAPNGAVSATETPRVYPLYERDSDPLDPFDATALLGAFVLLIVLVLAFGLAGWIEAL